MREYFVRSVEIDVLWCVGVVLVATTLAGWPTFLHLSSGAGFAKDLATLTKILR